MSNQIDSNWWKKLDKKWKFVFNSFLESSPSYTPKHEDLALLAQTKELNLNFSPSMEEYINKFELKKIEPLADFVVLESLSLRNNGIADISPLQNLTKLHTLNLGANNITDLTLLQNLRNLKKLVLDRNYKLTSLETLPYLESLEELNFEYIKNLRDISHLVKQTHLKHIYFDTNEFSDASALGDLLNLETLELKIMRKMSDISFLASLKKLENLHLSAGKIKSFEIVSDLKSLKKLKLSGATGSLMDISFLKNLTQLQELDLGYRCEVEDISVLQNCPQLTILKLSENKIKDISVLKTLTKLSYIRLENNQIANISALYALSDLKKVFLLGNEIPKKQIDDFKQKRPDVEVFYDV